MNKVYYVDNKKFQTTRRCIIQTKVTGFHISNDYCTLAVGGMLVVNSGFAWDGASGGIDTKRTIRASLAHDVLYKLMRNELLPRSQQQYADQTLRDIMRTDGAIVSRVWAWFLAVSLFGRRNTDPVNKEFERVAP